MLKQCTSCETIFSKTEGCECEACAQGDYSDHFKSGNLIDINPKDMFKDGALVHMCPKCMTYTRSLPNGESSVIAIGEDCHQMDQGETDDPYQSSDDNDEIVKHFNVTQYCAECESEMVQVKS